MNRRQMFKAAFAAAVATVLPIPAVLAWKERLSYSDIMRNTLSNPDVQRRMAENIARANVLFAELERHAPPSLVVIQGPSVRQPRS